MNRKVFKAVGILGLAIAAFAAPSFTTKANVKQSDTLWIQTAPGVWQQLTTQRYECDGTPNVCVMRFPFGTNPYDNPGAGTIESAEGFAVLQP